MKKVIISLMLGSLATTALAQSNLPPNSVVLGTHVLTPGHSVPCPDPENDPDPFVATPVQISLVNPQDVAGVQARVTYDATKVEVVNPGSPTSCYNQQETADSVLVGASPIINYEAPAGNVGAVNFALAVSSGTNTSGELVTLFFRPAAGATPGEVVEFNFDLSDGGKRFVVAPATSTPGTETPKNAVAGKFIIGSPNEASYGVDVASGSASTDGTRLFAVNDQGELIVVNPADNFVRTGAGRAETRLTAPVLGRPALSYDANGLSLTRIVAVASNGQFQVYNATLASFIQVFNETGQTTPAVPNFPAGATVQATPAVADGRAIFPDSAGNLYSVDIAKRPAASAPVVANGIGATPTSSPSYVDLDEGGAIAPRVVVGAQTGVLVLNAADLTPMAGVTIPTQSPVTSPVYLFKAPGVPFATGWVGDEAGNVHTFTLTAVGGGSVGGAVTTNSPVRASPFGLPGGIGAIVVNQNGQFTVVSHLGTRIFQDTFTLPAGAMIGVDQAPIVRVDGPFARLLVGDSAGNLHQANVRLTDPNNPIVSVEAIRNFGTGEITALTSPSAGHVAFLVNGTTLVKTNYPTP